MPLLAQSVAAPAGQIGLVGVDPAVVGRLGEQMGSDFDLSAMHDADALLDHLESGGVPLDAVVLGLTAEESVRIAQRIHTHDRLIPVVILSPAAKCAELKRSLMFSPFLGSEIVAWSNEDLDILPATLRETVHRHRQRVHHRNTLSTAQIRLEMLPLQRPEAAHYLDRLLDHAPVGVVTVDLDGVIDTLNREAQNILAVHGTPVLGQPLSRFFSGDEHERLAALMTTCADTHTDRVGDVFALSRDRETTSFIEITLAPLAYRTGQRGFMLLLQDVTSRVEAEKERQQAEDDLRHHGSVLRQFHEITSSKTLRLEEKLDQVLALGCEQFKLPVGLLTRVDGDRLTVVRAVGHDQGYASGTELALDSTFCGIALCSGEPLALEDSASAGWSDHPAYRAGGQRSYIGTAVEIDRDTSGTLCFFDQASRQRPFLPADSELIKLISRWIGSELQRERADALMRKLSGALERTADAIVITDHDRVIEYVNPSFEELTGYTKEEAIGQKTYFLRSGLHDRRFYDELWEVIGRGDVYRGTVVNRKKDGSLYYEQKTISPLRDEQGDITHFISTGHDITDLIEAEEKNRAHQAEMAHVARLSTLGEMTSGLAHELNQPLCAITTYAQTCLHVLNGSNASPDRLRYGLEQIVKQAELASEIFRRLRDFARKGKIRRDPVSINEVVREVTGFVTAEAQQQLVRLQQDIPADLAPVMGDAIQIEQVLLNLVRNAMDAVAGVDPARRRISIRAFAESADWVTVEIRDRGPGCPAEVVERLFEPFVTSKPTGLGIGLSISQGIIEAHGGSLSLAENSEDGAVFRFTLPVEDAA